MGYSKLKSRFSVAGRFTRFAIEDGFKIKGFYLDVAGEELPIKVPKRLRYYCADLLVPGATLQVSGKQTVYLKSDRTKYKAEDIIPLPTPLADVPTVSSATLVHDDVAVRDAAVCDAAELVAVNGHLRSSAQVAALGDRTAVQVPQKEKRHVGKPACIRVCQKSSCRKRGGDAVWSALEAAIDEQGLGDRVKLKATGCIDKCKAGPNVIMPGKMRYGRVKAKSIAGLLEEHITAAHNSGSDG